jgi:methanogenic corrinoid protein MtbC1
MAAAREQVVARECWTEAEAVVMAREQFAPTPRRRGRNEGASRDTAKSLRQAKLTRTIETEVIPRLLLAHGTAPLRVSASDLSGRATGAENISSLVKLVLGHELQAATSFVDGLRLQGASAESLCLDLLAPTARHLGELWEQDLCDFTEVTVGLWRLQQVLHELSPAFRGELATRKTGPRALLVPVVGEQHTFGLAMVVDFFRSARWNVWSGTVTSNADLSDLVRRESFAIVGFSVACGERLEAVAACIRAVRRASCNRAVGIMVGGPMFIAHPEFAALVGADATAVDGRQAVLQAEALLTLLTEYR